MSGKRNEIIEEQRKARQEFLNLKRMQQGEVEPEAKPSEVAVMPKTFKEKLQNFWYHYKLHTILSLFMAVLIAIVTVQCATREKYDFSVMYFAFTPATGGQLDRAEVYFEKFAKDLNGDGEVNVQVIDCSFNSELRDMQYRNASFSKVQSVIAAHESTVLYVIDESAKQYFENAFDESLFAEELLELGPDFYNATNIDKLTLPEGLMLGLRKIDGTAFEGNKEAEIAFSESQRVYHQIKKPNT